MPVPVTVMVAERGFPVSLAVQVTVNELLPPVLDPSLTVAQLWFEAALHTALVVTMNADVVPPSAGTACVDGVTLRDGDEGIGN